MTITRKLAVLAEHCAALGRDPAEIEKTVFTRLGDGESAEQFAQRCRALDGLGRRACDRAVRRTMDRGRAGHAGAARPLLDRVDRPG